MSVLFPDHNKPRTYNEQQTIFLDALFGEAKGDFMLAADIAGYSKNNRFRVIRDLRLEIIELAENVLARCSIKAAQKLEEALEDGATMPGANVKMIAAQSILDRVGVSKREKLEIKTDGPAGAIFILPAKEAVKYAKTETENSTGE